VRKYIFVPIKTNSTRVPNKNFRDFGGVPLYEHMLNKYANDDIIIAINTDNESLIEKYHSMKVVGKAGVHSHRREGHLIGDDISVNLIIEDFVNKFCEDDDIIAQIHTTSPFLESKTLIDAIGMLETNSSIDSVVSANVIQSRLWREEGYGYCPVNHNPMRMEKTQDLPKLYEENSCFYVFTAKSFKNSGKRIGLKPYFWEVNFPENLDIDTENDWDFCCQVLKNERNVEI